MNSITSPGMWLVNIFYYYSLYQRRSLEKHHHDDEELIMSQRELNKIYENPGMDISFKYSYIAKTFLLTVFYLPLFPLGAVISLFGIIFAYLIEKFNLLYRYKRPEMLDAKMGKSYVNFFKINLLVYALGNLLFFRRSESFAFDNFPLIGWVAFFFFLVLTLVPYQLFIRCVFLGVKEKDVVDKPYLDAYFEFTQDYDRANPLTRRKGIQIYLERLRKEGIVGEEEYNKLMESLQSEDVNILELYYRSNANVAKKAETKIQNLFKPIYNKYYI
jgi:hypothetical protein